MSYMTYMDIVDSFWFLVIIFLDYMTSIVDICTLYIVQCTQRPLYSVHCTVYILQCKLYTMHYTMDSVHSKNPILSRVQEALVHCTVYNVHCTLCILYTVQCTLYIVHVYTSSYVKRLLWSLLHNNLVIMKMLRSTHDVSRTCTKNQFYILHFFSVLSFFSVIVFYGYILLVLYFNRQIVMIYKN